MKHMPAHWEECVTLWRRWLRSMGLSPNTIHTRIGHVAAVARMVQTRSPVEVTTDHLLILLSEREYSREHRRAMRTSLNQFWDFLIQNHLATRNPAKGLPKVPESPPKPQPAPEWLWKELVESTAPRELLMVRLAGEAGLRRAEIAKVHRDDVIWEGDGYSLRVVGKGNKQRIVPINTRLAEEIQRGPRWVPPGVVTGYLFPAIDRWGNLVGDHVSPDRVGRIISDLMPPGWTAHKLRHRYATKGFAVTRNLRAVQEALGHASVATTQRYTAVSSRDVRAVADAVAGV